MGTKLTDQAKSILVVAKQHEGFAHDTDRQWRAADRHFLCRRDWLPIAAQKPPAGGSGASLREQIVVGLGQHLKISPYPSPIDGSAQPAIVCPNILHSKTRRYNIHFDQTQCNIHLNEELLFIDR